MNRISLGSGCILWLSVLAAQAALPQVPHISPTEPFTFVVLGDNRGLDNSGEQPIAFSKVLDAVKIEKPAFILDSGDMIYGHTASPAKIREQWRIYLRTIGKNHIPIFHV